MREPLFTRDAVHDPVALEAQAGRDLLLLESAARQWRWLGWLWFFGGIIVSLPLLIPIAVLALNQNNLDRVIWASAGIVIVLGFFLGIANTYFFLAKKIRQGRRWAVGVALFLSAVAAAATAMRIIYRIIHRQHDIGGMIIASLLLVGHLNMVKLLFQSYGAARRLQTFVSVRLDVNDP